MLIAHIYTCEVNSQANLNKIAAKKNTGYLAFRLRNATQWSLISQLSTHTHTHTHMHTHTHTQTHTHTLLTPALPQKDPDESARFAHTLETDQSDFEARYNTQLCRETTSVMIYHRRASLSEQHIDLLICHCTKQDSHTQVI